MTASSSVRLTDKNSGDIAVLAQPVHFKHADRTSPNRFLKAAMTERLSSYDENVPEKRGIPSRELIRVYEEWGKGGFGVILSGNTFGQYTHLEAKGNPIMRGDEPERAEAFKQMSAAAKAHGAIYITQLSHAGRQVPYAIQPNPVSASDVQLTSMSGKDVSKGFGKPTALTKDQLKEIVEDFANAAKYAYDTGSDGVQLHNAHGYLLAQFLAPSTNKRTDEYGGSLENRSRLLFECFDRIREKVPDPKFILGIKINSVEFQEGGFSTEECRDVCAKLEAKGVDFIELSGGTYESLAFFHKRESTKARESFFLDFADIIRAGLKSATIWVTGGFRTAEAMIEAVSSGSTQGIGLARPVCEEFDLPKKILEGQAVSARKTLVSDGDFGAGNAVCCRQIAEVGQGKQPTNTLDPDQINPLLKELGFPPVEAKM